MKHSYTYDEIIEMRKHVTAEIVRELNSREGANGFYTPESVSYATIEDRLRTYMQAGVNPEQMERSADVAVSPSQATGANHAHQ